MRRALPYRPRFNAPPRTTAAPRPRASSPSWIWWLLAGAMVALATGRTLVAQERHAVAVDSALAGATVDSAWARVTATYYDTTFRGLDWAGVHREARRRAVRARDMMGVRAEVEAMLERLGESHFAVIPAEVARGWEGAESSKSLGDVGISLRWLDGGMVVARVAAGSSAEALGIRSGWQLERIGTLDVARFLRERLAVPEGPARRLARLQAPLALQGRMQGDDGSLIRLVFRDGQGRQVHTLLPRRRASGEVVRFGHLPPQLVQFETERRADVRGCVGVVRFNAWMAPVTPRFDDAMVAFRDCRALILDLRGNVGGVAAMVMGVGGYVLDSSVSLGTMHTRGGALRYVVQPRRSDRHGRALAPFAGAVAVLVDDLSVSTSEIFAAGLQALGRARVFGEVTAGQALPAMLARLPNGDVMQHVVADFTAPRGGRIEGRGVVPDERVPLRRSALLAGRDEPLLAALAWIDARPMATAAGIDPAGGPRH